MLEGGRPGAVAEAVAGHDLQLRVGRMTFAGLLVGRLTAMTVEASEVGFGPMEATVEETKRKVGNKENETLEPFRRLRGYEQEE